MNLNPLTTRDFEASISVNLSITTQQKEKEKYMFFLQVE